MDYSLVLPENYPKICHSRFLSQIFLANLYKFFMTHDDVIADIALLNELRGNVFLSDRQKVRLKNLQFLPIRPPPPFFSLLLSLLFEFFIFQQLNVFYFLRHSPQWARTSSFTRFLDHTQRRTTIGRTPLDE